MFILLMILSCMNVDDSPALAAAKTRIQETIRGWISGAQGNIPL